MGTMGKHTIAETRELIALINFEQDATDTLIAKRTGAPGGLPQDDAGAAALARYASWRAAWIKERDDVLSDLRILSLEATLVPESVQPSELDYQRIVKVQRPASDPASMRAAINGVERVLKEQADRSEFRNKFPAHPDGFDPDLAVFKKADAAAKTAEAAAAAASGAAKKSVDMIPWWAWAGGAVILGGVTLAYVGPFIPRPATRR